MYTNLYIHQFISTPIYTYTNLYLHQFVATPTFPLHQCSKLHSVLKCKADMNK